MRQLVFKEQEMQLVDDATGKTSKPKVPQTERQLKPADQASCIDAAISLMSNIVDTACEREPDLDLMRLINFMDLYRVYIQLAGQQESDVSARINSLSIPSVSVLTQTLGNTELVSFERFVRDSRLLDKAATAASLEFGEKVSAPPPLTLSANG